MPMNPKEALIVRAFDVVGTTVPIIELDALVLLLEGTINGVDVQLNVVFPDPDSDSVLIQKLLSWKE